jgi:hypothetical protein
MNALILHDDTAIFAWLVGESLESADAHIANGYPELSDEWQAGTITAQEITVDEADAYRPDLFEVVAGIVQRKAE